MGDGEQQPSGLNLCTDSFSTVEVIKLINVLIIKYNLNCTLRNKKNPSGKIVLRSCGHVYIFLLQKWENLDL